MSRENLAGGEGVRIVVLASGRGGTFAALASALAERGVKAAIPALVTDRPGAPCVGLAEKAGVPVLALSPKGLTRHNYDLLLAERVAGLRPDWIFLLGWLRLLSLSFLERFPGRVVNLHPALPGSYPGVDAIRRAWEAAGGREARTGVMLHLVPDEGVDSGPLLASEELVIREGESLESLEGRVHELERRLVIDLATRFARGEKE